MVLLKDQGLIHEITTSVSYVDKVYGSPLTSALAVTTAATGTTS